jgi:uncharacterized protein YvpB
MTDQIQQSRINKDDIHSIPVKKRGWSWLLAILAILFFGMVFLETTNPSTSKDPSNVVSMIPTGKTKMTFPPTWTSTKLLPTNDPPSPTPSFSATPTPTLPSAILVHGMIPRSQKLPLDCESNDATLLAGFLGYKIDELEFHSALPRSDNPNRGFVGDVSGAWGNTPPEAYGVHAAPVSLTLRKFHVPVLDVYQYSLSSIKRQLADGYPVMAWVVGHVEKGKAIRWKSSDGNISYVAPYEHTVLVIGYDEGGLIILDNEEIYSRSYQEFLDSWSVLGYMAIIKYP